MLSPQTITELVKLREDEVFTDYVLVSEDRELHVHKVVVCSQSPIFYAACTGAFKEASGTYRILDFSYSMVRRMVDYLYTGAYDATPPATDGDDKADQAADVNAPLIHATMFAMGDKYLIKGLMAMSAKKYQAVLSADTDMCQFLLSMSTVYASTPSSVRTLRDIAAGFAGQYLGASLSCASTKQLYDQVTADLPEFTKDVLDSCLRQPVLLGSCSACGRKVVPIEALQCRCKLCGKGGAAMRREGHSNSSWR